MIYKKIGEDIVASIGLGTQGITNPNIINQACEMSWHEQAPQVKAFIDTAENYNNEQIIGDTIKGYRDKVFISTKFKPENNINIIKACDDSLNRLGTDYIDLYSLHWPRAHYPLEDTIDELRKLQNQGKICHVGACNLTLSQLKRVDIDVLQVEYSLFDRSIEKDILPYCQEKNIMVVAYSPLKYFYKLPKESMLWLIQLGIDLKRQIPPRKLQRIALNWMVSHPPVIVIPKTNNKRHLDVNMKAAEFLLAPELIERINSLFPFEVTYVEPSQVKISRAGKFPQTMGEAEMNTTNFCPSPLELSEDIDEEIKPLRVEAIKEGLYELYEGGLRYWAWRMKYGNKPVPVLQIGDTPETYIPKPDAKCEKHPKAKKIKINGEMFCEACQGEYWAREIGVLKD